MIAGKLALRFALRLLWSLVGAPALLIACRAAPLAAPPPPPQVVTIRLEGAMLSPLRADGKTWDGYDHSAATATRATIEGCVDRAEPPGGVPCRAH
jgi:hypothetical protein